jgi:hypothetical protein
MKATLKELFKSGVWRPLWKQGLGLGMWALVTSTLWLQASGMTSTTRQWQHAEIKVHVKGSWDSCFMGISILLYFLSFIIYRSFVPVPSQCISSHFPWLPLNMCAKLSEPGSPNLPFFKPQINSFYFCSF